MKAEMEALAKAVGTKNVMAVYRDEVGDCWSGIPVLVSPGVAVLARERDFVLDGYVALGADGITLVEQYDDNDFVARAMKGEGVYQSVAPPAFAGCKDWKELLEGVRRAFGGWCAVECGDEETGPCFYVGKMASLDPNFLGLRPVDADGRWHPETVTVPLQDILSVSFGGNYLRVYRKYTPKEP